MFSSADALPLTELVLRHPENHRPVFTVVPGSHCRKMSQTSQPVLMQRGLGIVGGRIMEAQMSFVLS